MIIKLNGSNFNFSGVNIFDLIKQLQYGNTRIAVEVNEAIIPKSEHNNFILRENDKVEIIKAVGGG